MHIQGGSACGRPGRPVSARLRDAARPVIGLGLLLVAAGSPGGVQGAAAAEAPVAVVSAEPIGAEEYRDFLRAYVRSKLYHGGSPERLHELADEALQALIHRRLVLQEANRRGISPDEASVQARIDSLRAQYADTESWPRVEPMLPALAGRLRDDSMIAALQTDIREVAPPTEPELAAFHAENIELFTEPPAWDLAMILVSVPPSGLPEEWKLARNQATEAVESLRDGTDFGALAAAISGHESAAKGGQIGRIHKGQVPDAAQEAIDRLAEGEISDPIQILEGFAIFRMNSRISSVVHDLDEVRARAEALYMRNTSESRWRTFLAGLQADAQVETFDVSRHVEALLAGE